jgi:hypothetical protein
VFDVKRRGRLAETPAPPRDDCPLKISLIYIHRSASPQAEPRKIRGGTRDGCESATSPFPGRSHSSEFSREWVTARAAAIGVEPERQFCPAAPGRSPGSAALRTVTQTSLPSGVKKAPCGAGGEGRAKPQGGDRLSPRTEAHADLIRAALAEAPDFTLQ